MGSRNTGREVRKLNADVKEIEHEIRELNRILSELEYMLKARINKLEEKVEELEERLRHPKAEAYDAIIDVNDHERKVIVYTRQGKIIYHLRRLGFTWFGTPFIHILYIKGTNFDWVEGELEWLIKHFREEGYKFAITERAERWLRWDPETEGIEVVTFEEGDIW